MFRSVALIPYHISASNGFRKIQALQPIFNSLYDAISRDNEWIKETFSIISRQCAWTRRELEAYEKSLNHIKFKPTLLLPNSIYLSPSKIADKDADDYICIVTNVQAGEPFQLQLAHDFQRATYSNGLHQAPLFTVTRTIAQAAALVHKENPVVAILSKPAELLALRTKGDVVGVAARLKDIEGISTVLNVSMQDLSTAKLDSNNDLIYKGHKISVVYCRYDFSHPSGIFDMNPFDDAPASPVAWENEWQTIEKIEMSTAVVSSNIGCRLAVRRRTHYVLATQKHALGRFLKDREEAALVRSVLPDQWSLDPTSGRDVIEEARTMFEAEPDGFVAKNVLRPRTGSGKTQDRTQSGGMILKSENEIRELFFNPSKGKHYILYRKINPKTHDSVLHHENNVHYLKNTATSELATYGAYLAANCLNNNENVRNVYRNCLAGIGSRTSVLPAFDSELAKSLGYGAINAVHVT